MDIGHVADMHAFGTQDAMTLALRVEMTARGLERCLTFSDRMDMECMRALGEVVQLGMQERAMRGFVKLNHPYRCSICIHHLGLCPIGRYSSLG